MLRGWRQTENQVCPFLSARMLFIQAGTYYAAAPHCLSSDRHRPEQIRSGIMVPGIALIRVLELHSLPAEINDRILFPGNQHIFDIHCIYFSDHMLLGRYVRCIDYSKQKVYWLQHAPSFCPSPFQDIPLTALQWNSFAMNSQKIH